MANASQTITRPPVPSSEIANAPAPPVQASNPAVPESWRDIRDARDIQFEELTVIPPEMPEPSEPGWFSEWLREFFAWLGDVLSPIASLFGESWPVMKWVLLTLLVALIAYLVAQNLGLIARRSQLPKSAVSEPEWRPSESETVALLQDADELAAQGRFDEATRLLLHRSVGQIAAARPEWVDPSSTARELASLPALSDRARTAFAAISERVERSLFALRSLDRADWETARAAYADFALVKIDTAEPEASQVSA